MKRVDYDAAAEATYVTAALIFSQEICNERCAKVTFHDSPMQHSHSKATDNEPTAPH